MPQTTTTSLDAAVPVINVPLRHHARSQHYMLSRIVLTEDEETRVTQALTSESRIKTFRVLSGPGEPFSVIVYPHYRVVTNLQMSPYHDLREAVGKILIENVPAVVAALLERDEDKVEPNDEAVAA